MSDMGGLMGSVTQWDDPIVRGVLGSSSRLGSQTGSELEPTREPVVAGCPWIANECCA
jgi:hypothetical protein